MGETVALVLGLVEVLEKLRNVAQGGCGREEQGIEG
jgi:hypothetical protein